LRLIASCGNSFTIALLHSNIGRQIDEKQRTSLLLEDSMQKIKRRTGVIFREEIVIDGVRYTRCANRKEDLKRWKRKLLTERDTHNVLGIVVNRQMLFSDFAQTYIERKIRKNLATSTITNYRLYLKNHLL